jgi:ParB family chromosome partitioning protein
VQSLKIDFSHAVSQALCMAKPALGRGLGALLGGATASPDRVGTAPAVHPITVRPVEAPNGERIQNLALDRIRPSPFQPRRDFGREALQELADSIKAQGVIQPLIVRERGGAYELIAGERRWRAAQLLGLLEVPAIVRQADDRTVLELALIENLQRENLNPLEEALGYQQLIDQFSLRQEDVATKVGKSRAVVANSLRLLNLDADVQNYVRNGQLSVGHAKVILSLAGAAEQKLAAERVIKEGLNVRDTEVLVARLQQPVVAAARNHSGKSAPSGSHVSELENRLRERFGTKVQLRYKQGKGSLEIRFFNDDDLDRILQIVGVSLD